MSGRPKFTPEQHLGIDPVPERKRPKRLSKRLKKEIKKQEKKRRSLMEPTTYDEIYELFKQCYEEAGPSFCLKLINDVGAKKLRDVRKADYDHIKRIMEEKLKSVRKKD